MYSSNLQLQLNNPHTEDNSVVKCHLDQDEFPLESGSSQAVFLVCSDLLNEL